MAGIPLVSWQETNIWMYWVLFGSLILSLIPVLQKRILVVDSLYSFLLPIDSTNNCKNINVSYMESIVLFAFFNLALISFLCFFHGREQWINFLLYLLLIGLIFILRGAIWLLIIHFSRLKRKWDICIKNYFQMLFITSLVGFVNMLLYVNFEFYATFVGINVALVAFYCINFFVKTIRLVGSNILKQVSIMACIVTLDILPIYLLYLYINGSSTFFV